MNRRDLIIQWLDKIEKDGIPARCPVQKLMWTETIKTLKGKETWDEIVDYVKTAVTRFKGVQTKAGPDAAQKVFKQIDVKIWSLNRKYTKVNNNG